MQFKDGVKVNEGGGMFLKLEDGETVMGVFRGEPREYDIHYIQGKGYIDCVSGCVHCTDGVKQSFRFRVNFVVKVNGALTPKIFENGVLIYNAMKELNKDYPLESTLVKLTRTGLKKDTVYSVLPVPPSKYDPKELAARLSDVQLLPLESKKAVQEESFPEQVPFDEQNPF